MRNIKPESEFEFRIFSTIRKAYQSALSVNYYSFFFARRNDKMMRRQIVRYDPISKVDF